MSRLPRGRAAIFAQGDAPLDSGVHLNIAPPKVIAAASYTLLAEDNGATLCFTSGNAVTVGIPQGVWSDDFQVCLLQAGAGVVTPSGATLHNRQSHTGTAGQWALAALVAVPGQPEVYVFSGDTA